MGRPYELTCPCGTVDEGGGEDEGVWSSRGAEVGRREWTAGARMNMALKGSVGEERSGIVRAAWKDSSWARVWSVGAMRVERGDVGRETRERRGRRI